MDDAIRSDEQPIRTGPVRTGLYLTLGIVLTALGLVGVGIYAFTPRNTPAEGDAQADAVWQSGVIIGAAVCTGVGVLLLLLALVASVRARREQQRPRLR
jgi:hypothetical protein